MSLHPLAGKPFPHDLLVKVPQLVSAYDTQKSDIPDPPHQVAFETSGHCGSLLHGSFNEDHRPKVQRHEYARPAGAGVVNGYRVIC